MSRSLLLAAVLLASPALAGDPVCRDGRGRIVPCPVPGSDPGGHGSVTSKPAMCHDAKNMIVPCTRPGAKPSKP